jgi:phage terminase large subunit
MHFNKKTYAPCISGKRYVIQQGGTGAGKTYSTLQYLLNYANKYQGSVISVVSETLPHLKRGALRDMKHIIDMEGWNHAFEENKSEQILRVLKSTIEFFPADSSSKLRGARRDILFINECNNVDFESFQQLDVRTRKRTILDFNPVRSFWVHDKLIPSLKEDDYIFNKTTFLDNIYLSKEEKENIERRRSNNNWWRVYGEGEIGIAEGLVFNNWSIIAPLGPPEGGSKESNDFEPSFGGQGGRLPGNLLGYGIDFGYTHSPTAIVQVNEYNGELYIKELFYRTHTFNDEIFAFASKHIDLNARAIADSNEPKTVAYLYQKGWRGLKAAVKGHDSVEFGINLLQQRKLNITRDSLNLIKELREYMWDTNHKHEKINSPVKEYDHAIDALRYLISYPKKRPLLFA